MKKIICLLALVILLSGCAIYSKVIPLGNNTFKVYRQAASGFVSPNATKCRTLSAANQFCIDQGKSLKILLFKEHQPPYILGNFPRAEIHFTCLDANDPELKTGEFVNTQQFSQCVEIGQNDNHILEVKLKAFNKLLSDGLITKNEFDEQKKKLLNDYVSK